MQLKEVLDNIHYLALFAGSLYLKYRTSVEEEEKQETVEDQWKEDKAQPDLRLVEPEDTFVPDRNIEVKLDKDNKKASDEAELYPKAPPPPSPTKKFMKPFPKAS